MNLVGSLMDDVKKQPKTIVIIGDVMTDVWIHGRIDECQDECVKLTEEVMVKTPGGAANAHRCLANWGVTSYLFGRAQNDCPVKYRFVTHSGKIIFRYDVETMLGDKSGYRFYHQDALEWVNQCDGVLLSDYDKGFLTPKFIQEVVSSCKKRGILCVADCKRPPEVYEGCILKGNWDWAKRWRRCNKGVVTRGMYGPLVDSKGVYLSVPDLSPVGCINHVGAGDCFASHLTLALAYGRSLTEAATIAHSAGRVYVQHPHNRPPLPEEIAADLDREKPARTASAASGSRDGPEPK